MTAGEPFAIAGREIALGEVADVEIEVSESFSGVPVQLPLRVMRVWVRSGMHSETNDAMPSKATRCRSRTSNPFWIGTTSRDSGSTPRTSSLS